LSTGIVTIQRRPTLRFQTGASASTAIQGQLEAMGHQLNDMAQAPNALPLEAVVPMTETMISLAEVAETEWALEGDENIEVYEPEARPRRPQSRANRLRVKNGELDMAWQKARIAAEAAHLSKAKSRAGDPDGTKPQIGRQSALSMYC
jgi:hypothetical protein